MDVRRFMKYFHWLFIIIGACVFIMSVLIEPGAGNPGRFGFGLLFFVMFAGIPGIIRYAIEAPARQDKAILDSGVSYTGKIFGYREDASILVNGRPMLDLIIRYFDHGVIKEAVVNNDSTDMTKFPVGATVTIRIMNAQAALVPGSVTNARLEGEENLMNPDFDPTGKRPSKGVHCPNCGSSLIIPYGMSYICPYCGSKVSLSENGEIIR
ncbi:MAG: hypothetical protein IKE68_01850 [Solobacterium sp.]|nr:hypothetical protein [Solobacterium sp.]